MPPTPHLLALATAVPPFAFRQAEVATLARKVFSARESEIERLLTVYQNAGIETRYTDSLLPLRV